MPLRPYNEKNGRTYNWNGVQVNGSLVRFATDKQIHVLYKTLKKFDLDPMEVWKVYFDEEYHSNGFEVVSMEACALIIGDLINYQKLLVEEAFMRKVARNEQEQHDYEMGIDRSLDSYGR